MKVQQRIVYEAVVGSKAWGLDDERSDTDRKGIWIGPPVMKLDEISEVYHLNDSLGDRNVVELRQVARKLIDGDLNMIELAFTTPLTKSDMFVLFAEPRRFLTEKWRLKLIAFCLNALYQEAPEPKHTVDVLRRAMTALHYFKTGEYKNNLKDFCAAETISRLKNERRGLGPCYALMKTLGDNVKELDKCRVDESDCYTRNAIQLRVGKILADHWHYQRMDREVVLDT